MVKVQNMLNRDGQKMDPVDLVISAQLIQGYSKIELAKMGFNLYLPKRKKTQNKF
jgi:hypothetical protein